MGDHTIVVTWLFLKRFILEWLFLERWEYQSTLLASWEIFMQVKKQQLELVMEQ